MGEGTIDCIPNTEEKYISFSKSIQDEEGKLNEKMKIITRPLNGYYLLTIMIFVGFNIFMYTWWACGLWKIYVNISSNNI